MSERSNSPVSKSSAATGPSHNALLQRRCACGMHTIAGQKCADCATKPGPLQRKLRIGTNSDPLEREADRVATQVLAAPAQVAVGRAAPHIQRFAGPATGQADTAPASVERVLGESGRPLDAALQQDMGQRFGHDFSQVRVHSGAAAEQSARDVNAQAYTVGHNIVFGTGSFAPGTNAGRHLLAHELTHVVQQSDKAGAPMVQRKETDPKVEEAAKKALGDRLWADFPQGVNVAFYQDSNDEAKRTAAAWSKREHALGLKKSPITASNLAFDTAISDANEIGATLTGISGVLKAAAATPPTGTTPTPGMGPDKVRSLALFAHGTSNWCGLGPITTGNAAAKVKVMAPALASNVNVLLLACNTGRGQTEPEAWVKGTMEGGGADSLAGVMRDALLAEGIASSTVWGHTTTGHVSENFALREFSGVSGKGAAGASYVSTYIFTATERAAAVAELQAAVTAKGYAIDDPTKFAASANAALTNVMYFCFAEAHAKFDIDGAKLGEAAPMHPTAVADVVKTHWKDTYWPSKQGKVGDALIKSLKLKKNP